MPGRIDTSLPAITATSYYLSSTRVLFVATTIRVSKAPETHALFVVVLFVCPKHQRQMHCLC